MSDAGSSSTRRISSPTGVPPGSRTAHDARVAVARGEPVGEQAKLRALARALRSLEDDQAAARHCRASRA